MSAYPARTKRLESYQERMEGARTGMAARIENCQVCCRICDRDPGGAGPGEFTEASPRGTRAVMADPAVNSTDNEGLKISLLALADR